MTTKNQDLEILRFWFAKPKNFFIGTKSVLINILYHWWFWPDNIRGSL